jgi:replicative superfamily II helicase
MTDDDLRLAKERLMKLWDAYESQEIELQAAVKKVSDLENRQKDKERVIETLRELVESKDTELRKYEMNTTSIERESTDYKTRLEEVSDSLNQERARYKKLFVITQELEREVDRLTKELDERDRWFRDNMSFFEEFPTRVGKRLGMASKPRKNLIEELGEGKASSKPALPPEDVAKTTFERVDPKEEAMNELLEVPGIDDDRATILVNAGYDSLDKLKDVSPFELVKLEGITPTIARKISDHLKA